MQKWMDVKEQKYMCSSKSFVSKNHWQSMEKKERMEE